MDQVANLTSVEKDVIREFIRVKRSGIDSVLIGPQQVANVMPFSRPRAYAVLSKLEEKGVLKKIERKGFMLTEDGEEVIREILHRTMVMETYFVDQLGMELADAEMEAQNVVLHVSTTLIDILCDRLGQPRTCPHNYVIPHRDN